MSPGRQRGWTVAAGLGAGIAMAASLPPWGWWPLAPVGAAVLAASLRDRPWWGRLLAGAAAGLGLYGPGLWWMTEFSGPGYVLTTLLEAGIVGLAMVAVPRQRGRLVAFPAAVLLADALHGHWPFGGLPLAGLALGQAGGPLTPAARLGGHLLLVGMVGTAGAALAALAEWWLAGPGLSNRRAGLSNRRAGRSYARAVAGLGALAGVVACAVAGAVTPLGTPRGSLRVAAVQGGGQRGLRAVFGDPQVPFDAALAASARIRPPLDLVLWPEDVVNLDGPLAGSPQEEAVAGVARATGATVVAGVVEDAPGGRFRNAAVAWAPDGRVVDRYDKAHRVPFGEYVPLRGLFSHLADLSAVPRDAIAGRGPGTLRTPAGTLGVVISYEVFFADRARAAARAGGEVLLVPTNASSYTTSQVPTQELAAARLRAVETGRDVVQAAPTGLSTVIGPTGRVRRRSSLGTAAVVQASVTKRRGQTPAVRLGDAPMVAVALAVLALARQRRRKAE
ncbi:MAG: apolipoprotein N-acyltransferase [Acidimicrobiales bacterium]